MNIKKARIHQLCQLLRAQADQTRFSLTNIEAVSCGYKTNNISPEKGWQPMHCFFKSEEHFWLRSHFTTPAPKEGKRYLLLVETVRGGWDATNPQGLIYLNGYMAQGLDTNHTETFLEAGTEYHLHIYFYTGALEHPILPSLTIIEQDVDTDKLYWDFKVPLDALDVLNENTSEYLDTLSMLHQAADLLDLRAPGSAEFKKSVKCAIEFLDKEFYHGLCTPLKKPVVHAIGHTHIDVEWRWARAQTKEKTQRSFATVTALMKEYPEYRFMMSQPNLYEYIKEEAPEKYEEIKELIRNGRWEAEGAMYVESDCNLTSGESLVRQILHGKKFFQEEFGIQSKILFLPDVFGYSGALPQILKKSGIDYFVTSKISWSDTNQMPHDSFLWEGIDGTGIYSTFITTQPAKPNHETENHTTYTGMLNPSQVLGTWDRYQNKEYNKQVFTTYGYGDGGGGPTKEMLEMERRMAFGLPGLPVTKQDFLLPALQAAEKEFYENAAKIKTMPKWTGELYLEFHRGTYTSVAKVKRSNRLAEFLLQRAEALSMTDLLFGGTYDKEGLWNTWKKVLHNQFHDILPGSSIGEVYAGTDIDYKEIFAFGNTLVDSKLKSLCSQLQKEEGLLVYNPLGFARGGNVTVDGQTYETAESIPAYGWKVIKKDSLIPTKLPHHSITAHSSDFDITPNPFIHCSLKDLTAENNYYLMKLDSAGRIISLYDKQAEREIVKPGEKLNEFQAFDDHPYCYEAWEISPYYKNNMYLLDEPAAITWITDGSRSGFEIKKTYMESRITQRIWLNSYSRRIDFDNEIDWHQKQQLLKIAFPLDIHTDKAAYEIQYGHVERPTHANTSWDAAKFEVCAHKWADLSEKGYGISLLNDCKYGYNTEGSTLKLTVLKCASYPWPEADEGIHLFSYALLPHKGDLYDAGVVKEAYAFNQPLLAIPIAERKMQIANESKLPSDKLLPDTFSLVSCDAPNIIIETVKKAEDNDDMIVRLYEAWNSRGKVTITVPSFFQKAFLSNLMEEDIEELELKDGKVTLPVKNFEIVTLHFVR